MKLLQKDINRMGDIVNDTETWLQQTEENRSTLQHVIELEVSTTSMLRALHISKWTQLMKP